MKLRNLKTWFSGMILGLSLLAAVPVSADITNSGSTPPHSPSENLIFRHKFSPFLSSVSLKTE
ncbi:MAG: hypothetical protein ACLRIQ_23585 [Blautia wexlerae]